MSGKMGNFEDKVGKREFERKGWARLSMKNFKPS